MAKPKFMGGLFREGAFAGVQYLFGVYWPLVFPVLTGWAQYVTPVPWPYFVAAMAFSVGTSLWVMAQLSAWRGRRRIDNKLMVALSDIEQQALEEAKSDVPYQYQLLFTIVSIHHEFLFVKLKTLTWEIGDSRPKSITEIEDDVSTVLPGQIPGGMQINSPTIEGIKAGGHSGKFSVCLQYGKTQEEMEYEVFLSGTFRILAVYDGVARARPPFRWNRMKYEVRSV